jgi:outer membrane protein OmpA-like peptidoglycan-associated protein
VVVVSDEWHVAGDVLIDLDRATVRSEAQPILDRIAFWLGRNPTVTLAIEGHTDASGDPRHNQELSEQWATATRDYLVSRGIAATRLSCVGRGESEPVAGNDTAADRQRNRRVVLIPSS